LWRVCVVCYQRLQGESKMSDWITVEDCLKGRALAVERERERIIKLLEEANTQYAQPSEESEALHAVIALIKGETNE
jgi:hypothetical protein